MKIYYAHPISMYGTDQEKRDIQTIEKLFPGSFIYNPGNDDSSSDGYKTKGMQYFYDIVEKCNLLIFRSFVDGKIGAGVWGEIEHSLSCSIPVLELPLLLRNRVLSVDDTREYLKLCGKR